jgi:hypothetical protein
MTIKGSVAFFLSPSGDLIHVPQNHISTVVADPQKFGLTVEEIQTVYDRHGEQMGVEGEARKELLLRIVAEVGKRRKVGEREDFQKSHTLYP